MHKYTRIAALGVSAALVVAACGSDDDEADDAAADESTEEDASTDEGTDEGSGDEGSEEPAPESDVVLGIAYDTGGRGDGTFNDSAGRAAADWMAGAGPTRIGRAA